MPVPGFLASFADKAQTAINATPLAGHLPNVGHPHPLSPDAASQPTADQAAAQGGKSLAMENISYQFRNLQQQYSTTTPIQRIITLEKGFSIDFEKLSRDAKSQSKELYTWGQAEAEDLKDVSDRLAYLNFVQGSLAASVAGKLDNARAPLKALRDAETNLQPKRNIRTGMQTAIGRLEGDQVKANDRKIADLREALKKVEAEDAQMEKELELLKRKALRESEQMKWDSLREYGEKLVLLSQAGSAIIKVLPTIPPEPASSYTGRDTTGAVRASLQRALDNYEIGHIHLPAQPAPGDLSRSDTQSFGESHASELSNIEAGPTPAHLSPPKTEEDNSSVINPHVLNQSPAPLPAAFASGEPASISEAASSASNLLPAVTPTITETGFPVSAGLEGPGLASGSLHDIRAGSPTPAAPTEPACPPAVPTHETAEEEKRRLASFYSPPVQSTPPASNSAPAPATSPATFSATGQVQRYESAEEEKKRQEREGLLRSNAPPDVPPKDEEELPPYQGI